MTDADKSTGICQNGTGLSPGPGIMSGIGEENELPEEGPNVKPSEPKESPPGFSS